MRRSLLHRVRKGAKRSNLTLPLFLGVIGSTFIADGSQIAYFGPHARQQGIWTLVAGLLIVLTAILWFGKAPRTAKGRRAAGAKALILMVGTRQNDHGHKAVEHHCSLEPKRLERVYLLSTDEAAPAAQDFKMEIENQYNVRAEIHGGIKRDDALSVFNAVTQIYWNHEGAEDEIIADFTAGGKNMAVGMVMACLPKQRRLQYVPIRRNPDETVTSLEPIEMRYDVQAFDLDVSE